MPLPSEPIIGRGLVRAQNSKEFCAGLMGVGAVEHTLQKYNFDTFVGHKLRPLRSRKTTKCEDRYLLRAAKQFNNVPLCNISKIVNVPISKATVSRRLHENGYRRYIARKKPYLSAKNIKERLEWAKLYKDWTIEQWKKVVWSDETMLQIRHSSKQRWVTHRKGEELDSKNVYPTFKMVRVTLMVWAYFIGDKVGPLMIFNEGGVGGDEYLEVILDGLLSFVDDLAKLTEEPDTVRVQKESPFIFMQDNARCHKVREVLDLLKEEKIPVMVWPAQSPNLNPLENLWEDFKERFYSEFLQLYGRPSKSQDSLYRYRELAQKVWAEQGQELIDRLIESMPDRCATVIAAGGKWTTY